MRKRSIAATKIGSSIPTSNARRQVVPNIAAAGSISAAKWADIKPTSSNANVKEEKSAKIKLERRPNGVEQTNSKLIRNRGKTTKNRGNDGQHTSIVKSEGVFSCGIGNEMTNQKPRGRQKQIKGEEIVIGKLETNLHEETIEDVNKYIDMLSSEKKPNLEEGQKSSNVYDEIWYSDHELDNDELKEIIRENFITDLKKAEQMPMVLPKNEEPQFGHVVQDKMEKDNQALGMICSRGDNETSNPKESNKIYAQQQEKFMMTAVNIHRILESKDDPSPLMLFQIPSSIFRVGQSTMTKRENAVDSSNNDNMKMNTNANNGQKNNESQRNKADQKNCVEYFSAFSKIGKLQFLRNGRILMNIGGNRMDISEAIPSDCFEALLRVENDCAKQSNASIDPFHGQPIFRSPSASTTNAESSMPLGLGHLTCSHSSGHLAPSYVASSSSTSSAERGNIAHLFGPLPYQFVCSFDFKCLLEKEMKRKEEKAKLPGNNVI